MDDPFDSPYQMLAWSEHHFKILHANIAKWSESARREQFVENEPITGNMLHKIRIYDPIPWYVPLIAFDCINSQRAALDLVIYAASVRLKTKEPKSTKFPFGSDFTNARNRALPKGSDAIEEIIDKALDFKPYEKDGDPVLYGLNQIRNIKHHRFLAPAAATASTIIEGDIVINDSNVGIDSRQFWVPGLNELTFMTTGKLLKEVKITTRLTLAIADGMPLQGQPILSLLNDTGGKVAKILDAIKAEAERMAIERGIGDQ